MEFDIPKERPSIIKVIGVGGGGSNAVNHMFNLGIKGVEFLVCNTDAQALDISPIQTKIQLGASLTEGRGAGSLPEIGKNSAIENLDDIKSSLGPNTKMVFVTAGMGGGTGTGAAPIIAGVAKEMGIITVGIVTVPFSFEGKKRKSQAEAGIQELKRNVDTLLIISNDKLRLIHGDLKLTDAFGKADDILTIAAKSIAEIITVTGYINVDFADVQTVLKDSGVAIMGRATYEGEGRAIKAAELALESPLLNDSEIIGARHVLLSIISGNNEVTMDEIGEITDFIQQKAGDTADIIFGTGRDETLGDKVCITVIATGFEAKAESETKSDANRTVIDLDEKIVEPIVQKESIVDFSQDDYLEPVLKSDLEKEMFEVPAEALNLVFPIEEKVEHDFVIRTVELENFDDDASLSTLTSDDYFEKSELISNSEVEFTVLLSDASNSQETESMHQAEPSFESVNQEIRSELKQESVAVSTDDDIYRKTKERINKLRQISYENQQKLAQNPNAIIDLEKEPAYKRRQVELEKVPDSAESNMSRMSLFEDADKNIEIRSNNSYIHDKVD